MINKGEQRGVTECGGRSNGCPPRMLSSCMCAASPSFFPDWHSACRAEKFPNPRPRLLPHALQHYKNAVPGCSEHDFAKASSAVLTPMVAAKKKLGAFTTQRFAAFRSCPKHDRGRAAPAPNNAASGTPGAFPHAGTPRMFSAEQDKRRFRRNRRALGFSDLPASVPA